MPRSRPSRLRDAARQTPTTVIPGVPISTSRALDRLGRPELSSRNVGSALATWLEVASKPRAVLGAAHNDWTGYVGPLARDQLERAMRALDRRQAAALRKAVGRADAAFRAKTLNNPRADRTRPWWARRRWH